MTIKEWNQLQPGDLIQIEGTKLRYLVNALGERIIDVIGKDSMGIVTLSISRNLWLDPLLSPEDRLWPDISIYEPGDAKLFNRI
jgi:hypothetical protein